MPLNRYSLRVPQRKPWGSMSDDAKVAQAIFGNEKQVPAALASLIVHPAPGLADARVQQLAVKLGVPTALPERQLGGRVSVSPMQVQRSPHWCPAMHVHSWR